MFGKNSGKAVGGILPPANNPVAPEVTNIVAALDAQTVALSGIDARLSNLRVDLAFIRSQLAQPDAGRHKADPEVNVVSSIAKVEDVIVSVERIAEAAQARNEIMRGLTRPINPA